MNLLETLLSRGIVQTEPEARGLILAGKVLVDDSPVTKPGAPTNATMNIRLRGIRRFVSRGGDKLVGALDLFAVPVAGRSFLDVGASTGGFTDVLLQRGAKFVAAIDVGRGLLHQKLRTDARVQVIEDCDFKTFNSAMLRQNVEAFVADVSFSSVNAMVLKAFSILTLVERLPEGLVLFKPQFELPRAEKNILEKGILRDNQRAESLIDDFELAMRPHGIRVAGRHAAAIKGRKGNQEFMLHLQIDTKNFTR